MIKVSDADDRREWGGWGGGQGVNPHWDQFRIGINVIK